jgi:type I restriction enzyme S subunit
MREMGMSEVNVPKLRFGEFEGEWVERKLGDITKINQGLQISISERFLEKVTDSYFYITNEFLRKGSEKKYFIKNPPESVICTKDDILMTRTGNTGQVVTNVNGAFHNNFFKIKYDVSINKDFFIDFLRMQKTQNMILRLAGTSTIPDLNHGDFYKLKINLPSINEQQKISKFLTSIDQKIEQLNQKRTLLESYKKGLMQKIFSQ